MDAARAISLVLERIGADGLDYPTEDLRADRFEGGWCVYAPAMIADDPAADADVPATRTVFLVNETGRVEDVSSSEPPEEARRWFEEACVWFTAAEPVESRSSDPTLPPHPDLGGSSRPRPAAGYDREAVDLLSRALTQERDFAGWLAERLRDLADLLGGGSRLVSRRPDSPAARHVAELVTPYYAYDERTGVWRTWPAVDPASLPDADTTGWLLVPCVTACEYLADLEGETPAATPLADVIADRARRAPRWRACGVAELMPQLVALRRTERVDADLATLRRLAAEHGGGDVVDALLVPPAPGDADVEALLRIAVDADRHHREVIDVGAAATAAYRRVLDRIGLPFENYAYEAMFE